MRLQALDEQACILALTKLSQRHALPWPIQHSKPQKSFRCSDFRAAFAFMTRVAEAATSPDHHPGWRTDYNRVQVTLTTHNANSLTELDPQLADAMEDAAAPP